MIRRGARRKLLAQPAAAAVAAAARRGPRARQTAPVDLTGNWVSIVTEDWQWRMRTPPKGDYASVPLTPAGRQAADTWTDAKDGQCEAYGVGGLMRMPGRLRISWQDDNTLKIETDAGQQTRLLRFAPPPARRRARFRRRRARDRCRARRWPSGSAPAAPSTRFIERGAATRCPASGGAR